MMMRSFKSVALAAAGARAGGRAGARWSPPPKISARWRARSAATRSPSSSLAKGYQDPHFVDPKPSFILAVSRADLLIVVGRELEIGWLPPLLTSSRNAKIQPGNKGYLDASQNVKILEIPTGQITRAMGDVHPLGNPHYWLDPGNGRRDGAGDSRQAHRAVAGATRRTSLSATPTSISVSPPPKRNGMRRWRPTRARRS